MKSSFTARRKPRIVGQTDDVVENVSMSDNVEAEEGIHNPNTKAAEANLVTFSVGVVVKKPPSKPKNRSGSRLSFGSATTSMTDDDSTTEVFTPKKSSLSRQAIEQNALRKSALAASVSTDHIPVRPSSLRPSYSREDLSQLKSSTPSTPHTSRSLSAEPSENQSLDIASKFGMDLTTYEQQTRNSAIPTDAEIQEKKVRRARLAQEKKYKPRNSDSSASDKDEDFPNDQHDSDEDEFRNQHDTISLGPSKSNHPLSRLDHDDEDIMEGFDDYVDDGKISLGRKAEREAKRKHRVEMEELIAAAEGSSSDNTDDSERERREEYEAAQTRRGMEGLKLRNRHEEMRPRTPPKIPPLPDLASGLQRLRATLIRVENSRAEKVRQIGDSERERKEIAEREEEIQRLLKETGERYERLHSEAGLDATEGASPGPTTPGIGIGFGPQRGLESLGTPLRVENGIE